MNDTATKINTPMVWYSSPSRAPTCAGARLHEDAQQAAMQRAPHDRRRLPPHALQALHHQRAGALYVRLLLKGPPSIPACAETVSPRSCLAGRCVELHGAHPQLSPSFTPCLGHQGVGHHVCHITCHQIAQRHIPGSVSSIKRPARGTCRLVRQGPGSQARVLMMLSNDRGQAGL